MPGGYDSDFIRTLTGKVNIIDVALSYMNLEKRGGTYWACCPFHREKTPSFHVDGDRQFYYCFGCGASGDVIKLVREMENVDFQDAVTMLADRANIPVPETTGYDAEKTAERKRKRDIYLKIMNDTAHFYLDNLNSGKADEHVKYILSREIPSGVVRAFGLGASLNYTDLPQYLLSKGYSAQDMVDCGAVARQEEGRLTDAQSGRLIFPIVNALGEVVAFGGRALKKTDIAKYKNTKDTLIFHKSEMLYNINGLKKLRKEGKLDKLIIVEGYMDAISLYKAGFRNVVASMGTSLTQDQARLMKRYCSSVLISYDGDFAGQKANIRGLDILKGEGLEVRVVPLPKGLDPDDVIKRDGAEGYSKCLENAMPLNDYKMAVLREMYDITDPEEKIKYISDAMRVVNAADSAAEKEIMLKRISSETGISYESLNKDLSSVPPARQIQAETLSTTFRGVKDTADRGKKASRYVAAAFLFGARYADDVNIDDVPFEDDVHRIVALYIKTHKQPGQKLIVGRLFDFFEDDTPEYEEVMRIIDLDDGNNLEGDEQRKYFEDCLNILVEDDRNKTIERLKKEIASAEDKEERTHMLETLNTLVKEQKKRNQ